MSNPRLQKEFLKNLTKSKMIWQLLWSSPVWSQSPAALFSLPGGSSGCSRRMRVPGVPGRTGGTRSEASLLVVDERRAPVCPPPGWMCDWCPGRSLTYKQTDLTRQSVWHPHRDVTGRSRYGCASDVPNLHMETALTPQDAFSVFRTAPHLFGVTFLNNFSLSDGWQEEDRHWKWQNY